MHGADDLEDQGGCQGQEMTFDLNTPLHVNASGEKTHKTEGQKERERQRLKKERTNVPHSCENALLAWAPV